METAPSPVLSASSGSAICCVFPLRGCKYPGTLQGQLVASEILGFSINIHTVVRTLVLTDQMHKDLWLTPNFSGVYGCKCFELTTIHRFSWDSYEVLSRSFCLTGAVPHSGWMLPILPVFVIYLILPCCRQCLSVQPGCWRPQHSMAWLQLHVFQCWNSSCEPSPSNIWGVCFLW